MRLRRRAEQSMLWPVDLPVSQPRWQDDGVVLMTNAGSGPSFSASCARYAPAGSWQRTLSESLLSSLVALGGSPMSLRLKASKSGRSLLVPTTLERRIEGSGCGSWPTATAGDAKASGTRTGTQLLGATRLSAEDGPPAPESYSTDGKHLDWPTPDTSDGGQEQPKSEGRGLKLASVARGSLNPAWVTQLMGFPDGWLDSPPPATARPRSTPSETHAARKLSRSSSARSSRRKKSA